MSSPESPDDGGTGTDGSRGESGDTDASAADGEYPLTRRQAIAGGGIAVLLGAGLGASHVLRPARAVHPEIPDEALESNGWVRIAETSETVLDDAAGPVDVEAIAATVQYENQGLVRETLDAPVEIEYRGQTTTETLGSYVDEFDQSMGVFAATKIDVTPHIDELPGGLGRAEVMDRVETQARTRFEQQLRDAGLENVSQTATSTIEIDTGPSATLVEYRATFAFEPTEATVRGATVDIPGEDIEIAGYLAIWHNGRNVLIGAGAHPNENHEGTVTDTVQGAELTLSFDLALDPSSLRAELLGYVRRIE
jgi:hypothetical protein